MLRHMDLHQEGKTGYLEMAKDLTDSGIDKRTFDTNKMTLDYYGRGE